MKLKTSHKILIVGGSGLFLTILFGFAVYTPILKMGIKSQKALIPGNEMRDVYLKLPFPLDFNVYFFNVTNPEEVQDGGRPVLEEIGPYSYDAFKEKIVVDENDVNDTLTYSPFETYFFNENRSGSLTQDDYVTILNPLSVGIINTVADQKPHFLKVVDKALSFILKEDYSIYITTKVRDILFDGVKVDCNVQDFSAKAVCSQFRRQPSMQEKEKNIFMFSIFGGKNGSSSTQISVHRGTKNGKDTGRVIAIDNQTDLKIWSESRCNEYRGTDGWIFPSLIKGDVDVVAADLCRNFQARYVESFKFHGVKVKKYFTDFGNDTCYCPKPDKCLPTGVLDMTKCLQVPLLCTLPHFLHADERLLKDVEGLKPDVDRHIIKIYLEPTTGSPLLGQRRIQFNLQLRQLSKISIMKNVSDIIHPIMWLEEGVELEGHLLNKIITVTTLLKTAKIMKYVFLLIWTQLIAYGCYRGYKEWKGAKITPISSSARETIPKRLNNEQRKC